MFRGDFNNSDLDSLDLLAKLGMESRSILKSIQTEETKLLQSPNLTRSDKHYFRARFNYYRLSILRLPLEERSILEPFLARFSARLTALETEDGEVSPPPFLSAVENPVAEKVQASQPLSPSTPLPTSSVAAQISIPASLGGYDKNASVQDAISQLGLIRLALSGELSPEAKRLLGEGVERVIASLRRSTYQ